MTNVGMTTIQLGQAVKNLAKSGELHQSPRAKRVWAGLLLFILIVLSWLYNINFNKFDIKFSIGHLIAAIICLSLWDRELAFCWFEKLMKLRKGSNQNVSS